MASKEGVLRIRLVDGVSGPARNAAGALRGLDKQARGMNGARNLGRYNMLAAGGGGGRAAAAGLLAAGGKGLALGGGGYLAARSVGRGFKDFADVERHLTRIMNTAEASRREMEGVLAGLERMAIETAMPIDKVVGGLDTLVQQGRNLKDSLAFLPSVVRSAQASGAEVDDIARSADAISTHLKVGAQDMQAAFDILQAGGKAGQFELKDMARYLPSMLPAAKALGITGKEGLTSIVAMLQVIRKGTGSAEEAGTSLQNIFQKLESEETVKNFKKMGVDLEAAMKKGRAEGRNLIEVFEEAAWKATKGDLSQIPKLIHDMEFARGLRAVMSLRGEWQKLAATIRTTAPGSTMKDLAEVTNDAAASMQNFQTNWQKMMRGLARAGDAAGAFALLGTLGEMLDELATKINNNPFTNPKGFAERNAAMTEAWKAEEDAIRAEAIDKRIRELENEKDPVSGPFARPLVTADIERRREAAEAELQVLRLQREVLRLRNMAGKLPAIVPATISPSDTQAIERTGREQLIDDIRNGRKPLRKGLMLPRSGRPSPATPYVAPPAAQGFDGSLPSSAPHRPGVTPATPIRSLEEMRQKASDAGAALDRVDGKTVAPTVDTGSIDAALAKIRQLKGELGSLGGMSVSPAVTPKIAPAPASGTGPARTPATPVRSAAMDVYADYYPRGV